MPNFIIDSKGNVTDAATGQPPAPSAPVIYFTGSSYVDARGAPASPAQIQDALQPYLIPQDAQKIALEAAQKQSKWEGVTFSPTPQKPAYWGVMSPATRAAVMQGLPVGVGGEFSARTGAIPSMTPLAQSEMRSPQQINLEKKIKEFNRTVAYSNEIAEKYKSNEAQLNARIEVFNKKYAGALSPDLYASAQAEQNAIQNEVKELDEQYRKVSITYGSVKSGELDLNIKLAQFKQQSELAGREAEWRGRVASAIQPSQEFVKLKSRIMESQQAGRAYFEQPPKPLTFKEKISATRGDVFAAGMVVGEEAPRVVGERIKKAIPSEIGGAALAGAVVLPVEFAAGAGIATLGIAREATKIVTKPLQTIGEYGEIVGGEGSIIGAGMRYGAGMAEEAVTHPARFAGEWWAAGQIFGAGGALIKGTGKRLGVLKTPKVIRTSSMGVLEEVSPKKSILTKAERFREQKLFGREVEVVSSLDIVPLKAAKKVGVKQIVEGKPNVLIPEKPSIIKATAKPITALEVIEPKAKIKLTQGGIQTKMEVSAVGVKGMARARQVGLFESELGKPSVKGVKAAELKIFEQPKGKVSTMPIEGRAVSVYRELKIPKETAVKWTITSQPKLVEKISMPTQKTGLPQTWRVVEKARTPKVGVEVVERRYAGFSGFGKTAVEAKASIKGFFEKQKTISVKQGPKTIEIGKVSEIKTPMGDETVFSVKRSPNITEKGFGGKTGTVLKAKRLDVGYKQLEAPKARLPAPRVVGAEIRLASALKALESRSAAATKLSLKTKPSGGLSFAPALFSVSAVRAGGGLMMLEKQQLKTRTAQAMPSIAKTLPLVSQTKTKPIEAGVMGGALGREFERLASEKTVFERKAGIEPRVLGMAKIDTSTRMSRSIQGMGLAFSQAEAQAIQQGRKQSEALMQKSGQAQLKTVSQAKASEKALRSMQGLSVAKVSVVSSLEAQGIAQTQLQAQAQAQKQVQRQAQKQAEALMQKSVIREAMPFPRGGLNLFWSLPKPVSVAGAEKKGVAFDVFVRRSVPKGKSKVRGVKVGEGLPFFAAQHLGFATADKWSDRTVVLQAKGRTNQQDREPSGLGNKFNKKKGLIWIEKNKYAIDSREEKRGIPYKGKLAKKAKKHGFNLMDVEMPTGGI